MSASGSTKRDAAGKQTRSRNGCCEYRRLHRRCDEQYPSCESCLSRGKTCSYAKNFSWGGRPFGKLLFGKALAAGVVPIHLTEPNTHEPLSFVYCVVARPYSPSTPKPLCPVPNWSSRMPQEQRSLIDHFTRNLTPCFTLCQIQHNTFCSIFLPLTLDTVHGTPLRAAILLSALVHQNSFGSAESDVRCATLYQSCIRHLRENAVGKGHRLPSDRFCGAGVDRSAPSRFHLRNTHRPPRHERPIWTSRRPQIATISMSLMDSLRIYYRYSGRSMIWPWKSVQWGNSRSHTQNGLQLLASFVLF